MPDKTLAFFGCAMRGQPKLISTRYLASLRNRLARELGLEFISKHQTSSGSQQVDLVTTSSEIHDRDWRWLSDVAAAHGIAIFEITNPTTGGGSEISDGIGMAIPTIILYHSRIHKKHPSGYTCGKEGSRFVQTPVRCKGYSNSEEAVKAVREFMEDCGLNGR